MRELCPACSAIAAAKACLHRRLRSLDDLARQRILHVRMELPAARRASQPSHRSRREQPSRHELLREEWGRGALTWMSAAEGSRYNGRGVRQGKA